MISKRHWLIAGAVAISVHAAGFYTVFYTSTEGSKAPGDQGIQFDLGMMGDMGAAAQTSVAQQEVVPKAPQEEPVEEAPKKVEPKVVEETPPEPVEEKKPDPIPEKAPESKPVAKPESVVKAKPPVVVKQKSPVVMPKMEPKPKLKVEPKPKVEVKTEPVVKQTPKKDAQVVDTKPHNQGPTSQASQKATTGRSTSVTTGGNPGAKAKYFTQLAAAFAQNKRYPRASRRRNEEGVVTLSFIAYANGDVSDATIRKSSGYRRLDKAVLDMLRRATPLPAFSEGMTKKHLNITLPVSFKLSEY